MNSEKQLVDKRNLTGQTFARLTVIGYEGQNKHTSHMWRCKCECGNEKVIKASNLRNGHTKSCGCIPTGRIKHGHTWEGGVSPEYQAWKNMRNRCGNPKYPEFKYYGARGISVCEKWMSSFESFLEDMGARPYENASLERNDVNGNYEKANCRWASREDQDNNRRDNVRATINGRTQTVMQWIRELNLPIPAIYTRISRGMSPEEALTKPILQRKKRCPSVITTNSTSSVET